jgi:hypothetical protein
MTEEHRKSRVEKFRRAATTDRRSELYRWMDANYEAFVVVVNSAGKPNWRELARAFGEERLWDRTGKAPTAEGARQTWWQVRKARQSKQADRAPVRARLENFDSKRDVPFPVEALRKDDDDFEIHDVMGRPIK